MSKTFQIDDIYDPQSRFDNLQNIEPDFWKKSWLRTTEELMLQYRIPFFRYLFTV